MKAFEYAAPRSEQEVLELLSASAERPKSWPAEPTWSA